MMKSQHRHPSSSVLMRRRRVGVVLVLVLMLTGRPMSNGATAWAPPAKRGGWSVRQGRTGGGGGRRMVSPPATTTPTTTLTGSSGGRFSPAAPWSVLVLVAGATADGGEAETTGSGGEGGGGAGPSSSSLREILQELADRGLPFSPSATRLDLEALLALSLQPDPPAGTADDDGTIKNRNRSSINNSSIDKSGSDDSNNNVGAMPPFPSSVVGEPSVSAALPPQASAPSAVGRGGGAFAASTTTTEGAARSRRKNSTNQTSGGVFHGTQGYVSDDGSNISATGAAEAGSPPSSAGAYWETTTTTTSTAPANGVDAASPGSGRRWRRRQEEERRRRRRRRRAAAAAGNGGASPSATLLGGWVPSAAVGVARAATGLLIGLVPERLADTGAKAFRVTRRRTVELCNDLLVDDVTFAGGDKAEAAAAAAAAASESRRGKRRSRTGDDTHETKFGDSSREQHYGRSRRGEGPANVPRSHASAAGTSREGRRDAAAPPQRPPPPSGRARREVRPERGHGVLPPRPIHEILQALDDYGVPYPPTSSRQELETLLSKARAGQTRPSRVDDDDGSTTSGETKVRDSHAGEGRRSRGGLAAGTQYPSGGDSSLIIDAMAVVERGETRAVAASPRMADDDDAIEVESISPEEWQRLRQVRSSSSSSAGARKRIGDGGGRTGPTGSFGAAAARAAITTTATPSDGGDVERRPSTASRRAPSDPARRRHRPAARDVPGGRGANRAAAASAAPPGRPTRRRIYSPYGPSRPTGFEQDDAAVGDEKDGLERFGEFLADSVDNVLWGSDSGKVEAETDARIPRTGDRYSTPRGSVRSRRSSKKNGHWKDRMEEQLDYMLGIHENDISYDQWTNREREDAENATTGRASKQQTRRNGNDRPYWEEDGSVFSVLFGTDRSGRDGPGSTASIGNDLVSALRSHSVTMVLRSVLLLGAKMVGTMARWASVGGSIPPPIVALGTLSAGLLSRPGGKIKNMIFWLLSVRVVGEFLQGYLYSDDDDTSIRDM